MLNNRVLSKSHERHENLKVFVRIRPKIATEQHAPNAVYEISQDRSIKIIDQAHLISTRYNRIFDDSATQHQVFEEFKDSLTRLFEGYNCTIFAYGQTGTGKTHTIFGDHRTRTYENAGILPRSIDYVFTCADSLRNDNNGDCKILCSFLQIYNEKVYDLMQETGTPAPLDVREDASRGAYVENLSEYLVKSREEMLYVLHRGCQNRVKRQTKNNLFSSRSHTIFRILVERQSIEDGVCITSTLNICDLAGSEKWNKTEMAAKHIAEMTNINLSLTTLGKVISALAKKAQHVPYRDSKLTRLLQHCLGKNTDTYLIATISPLKEFLDETVSTLKFADRAKQVMTTSRINITSNDEKALICKLQGEIAHLQDTIQSMTRGNKNVIHLHREIMTLREENQRLKEQHSPSSPSPSPHRKLDRLVEENQRLRTLLQGLQESEASRSFSRMDDGVSHSASESIRHFAESPVKTRVSPGPVIEPRFTDCSQITSDNRAHHERFVMHTPPRATKSPQTPHNYDVETNDATPDVSAFPAGPKTYQPKTPEEELRTKLEKNGRCTVCTLPLPCMRHSHGSATPTSSAFMKPPLKSAVAPAAFDRSEPIDFTQKRLVDLIASSSMLPTKPSHGASARTVTPQPGRRESRGGTNGFTISPKSLNIFYNSGQRPPTKEADKPVVSPIRVHKSSIGLQAMTPQRGPLQTTASRPENVQLTRSINSTSPTTIKAGVQIVRTGEFTPNRLNSQQCNVVFGDTRSFAVSSMKPQPLGGHETFYAPNDVMMRYESPSFRMPTLTGQ